jgi:hypothetical protein
MGNTKRVNRISVLFWVCLLIVPVLSCGDDDDGSAGAGGAIAGTGGSAAGAGGAIAGTGGSAAGAGGAIAGTGGSGGTGGTGGTGAPEGGAGGTGGEASEPVELDYSDDALWLCKPGLADNPCESNADATEVLADNSLGAPVALAVKTDADFDCFYIYPTVDQSFSAGNHMDLTDIAAARSMTNTEVARFSTVCRVYAPRYRQMTIGCYMSGEYQQHFDFAYADVVDAFEYYLANENDGRDLVLIGHSQGAHILTQLLKDEFDGVQEMTDRLISALLIGTSELFVPEGEVVGGTFAHLPLCASDNRTGCIVAYNSINAPATALAAGRQGVSPPEGQEVACMNPAAPAGGKAHLTTYATEANQASLPDLTTPFALYRDYFTGECIGEGAAHALLIEGDPVDAGDQRESPYDFAAVAGVMMSTTSLHMIDVEIVQGDLLELVANQAASR